VVGRFVDLLTDETIVLDPQTLKPGVAGGHPLEKVRGEDGAFDANASEGVG
jgi:hypothetical protein